MSWPWKEGQDCHQQRRESVKGLPDPRSCEQRLQGGPAGLAGGWCVGPRERGPLARGGAQMAGCTEEPRNPAGPSLLRGRPPHGLVLGPWSLTMTTPLSLQGHTLWLLLRLSLSIVQSCPQYKCHYCKRAASGWVAPRSGGSCLLCGLVPNGARRGVLWANCCPTEGTAEQAAGSWHSSGLGAGPPGTYCFPWGLDAL